MLVLLAPWEGRATRFAVMNVEQLAAAAELVVWGRVKTVEALADGRGGIFTRTALDPLETWKGSRPNGPLEVVAAGGVLGDRSVAVLGQPEYAIGDEAVLFLVRNPAGEWVTVGLAQGYFAVRRDRPGGAAWVQGLVAAASVSPDRAAGGRRLTLTELKARTREVGR